MTPTATTRPLTKQDEKEEKKPLLPLPACDVNWSVRQPLRMPVDFSFLSWATLSLRKMSFGVGVAVWAQLWLLVRLM